MRRSLLGTLALSLAAAGLLTTTGPAQAATIKPPNVICSNTLSPVVFTVNFGKQTWHLDVGDPLTPLNKRIFFTSDDTVGAAGFEKLKRSTTTKKLSFTDDGFFANYTGVVGVGTPVSGTLRGTLNKKQTEMEFLLVDDDHGVSVTEVDLTASCTPTPV